MHPLEKKTLQTIQQQNLLPAGEKVVIGVSGGPDSMALLHVLARLAPILDITLAAAHVNHGLRPAEAEKEEVLAATAAKHLGVEFFSGTVDVKGLAANRKFSLEHAARLLRYDFLENILQRCGAQKIALAHTADDQAEEILLRLVRGTARKGLSGMRILREAKFIRPFLPLPKSLLLQYLDQHSIPFLLDSSNTQNRFLRNRIRNELLPYLAERFNPDIRQTLIRTAAILRDEEELLATITAAAFAKTVTIIQKTATRVQDSNSLGHQKCPQALQVDLDPFTRQPRAVQRRILEKGCWLMACTPRSRQIEQLLQLVEPGSSAVSLHLAAGLRVTKSREYLRFAYPHGAGPYRGSLLTETGPVLNETRIPAPGTYEFPDLHKRLTITEITEFMPGSGDMFTGGEYLDGALFSFPLTLRKPEPGDRFHPLGAPGSKKVFDFLSEQKVERQNRMLVPVLCADDLILALPGLRIDHRFRITEKTTRAIRLNWEEIPGEPDG